ncbi:MAG: hypothetical protein ACJ8MR_06540 [Povalibacter sp.]
MSASDATQVLQTTGAWSDPRVHLLDDTWLLTIFAILLATALPWLAGAFDIHFMAATFGLLALGAIHSALSVLVRPERLKDRRALLTSIHVAGVVIAGFVWMQAGGLQNPAFLMVFALPVVGAIFLSRWQPYLMALVAVITAAAVAIAQAPELRWYVPGLSAAGAWLGNILGQQGAAAVGPFAGFYAPTTYYLVLLEVFAVFVFACAIAAEYLGTVFERLHAHADIARIEAERSQQFWWTLIEELPTPAILVDADTLHIVSASKSASELAYNEIASGANLFDTVRFSYPEMVQELISQAGGTLPLSMIQISDGLRATEVHVQHVARKGRRLALVSIHDKTEEFTSKAALDVSGQAALVIDSRARILTFNKPARALFANVQASMDASKLLTFTGMPERWWELSLGGRRKAQVEIPPRIYEVTTSTSPLPGEEERLYIVTFLPVARAPNGTRIGLGQTAQLAQLDSTGTNRTLVSLR